MYPNLARNILYPCYQLYSGRNELGQLEKLKKNQWNSYEIIRNNQWKKLKQLLLHAYNTVPYYHELFNTLSIHPSDIKKIDDFQTFPFLDKQSITNNSTKLFSEANLSSEMIRDSTGGSTGVNLTFYYDDHSILHRRAIEMRANEWAGLNIGDKYAKLWGSSFDIQTGKQFKERLYSILFRQLLLSSYNLSEETMKNHTQTLIEYKPKCILGYSSSLYVFASYLQNNNIHEIQPHSLISSAEVLHDHQRKLIEQVFNTKIFNRYGCREFSTIAQECDQHRGFHINSEHVFLEVINKDGKPCNPGEKGELVITDLDNHAFPFIRYRIGDLGVMSEDICPCGRGLPLLETIDGRVFDVIIGTNGKYFTGTFWTILLRTGIKGIEQFQVIQHSYGSLILKLVVNESFTSKQHDSLKKFINHHCGEDLDIDIETVDTIPPTISGKQRFIISNISPFNIKTREGRSI